MLDGGQRTARARDEGHLTVVGVAGAGGVAVGADVYLRRRRPAQQTNRRIMERPADGRLEVAERRRRTRLQDELGHSRPRHARPHEADRKSDGDQQL